jgi:transcriptional regulator with PAS, ATPase and Fis domain
LNKERFRRGVEVTEAMRPQLIGADATIRAIQKDIACAARCDAKVLITGESGVGKEVVARLIHQSSDRSHNPLMTINCAGLPESLLESELFGHVRGSFTGAHRDKVGLLQMAAGGTLLMDEVGEMSLRMQALLLRFLETGEIQKVGSDGPQGRVDVRIIAATNQNLLDQIATKCFREDLYYRLNVIHLMIAPLRERREDIPLLTEHFLRIYSATHGFDPPQLSAEVWEYLQRYHWPGNVRELRNLVERLVVRGSSAPITLADLPPELAQRANASSTAASYRPPSAIDTMYTRITAGDESFWDVVYVPFMQRDLTRDDLRAIIRRGLEDARGSYKLLIELFNLPPGDYKRFLNFLRKHDCHMPFRRFRCLPGKLRDDAPHVPRASSR